MDIGTALVIFSGCAVVVAAILKLVPAKAPNGHLSCREFKIWQHGQDAQWRDLKGWIETIQKDVEYLKRSRMEVCSNRRKEPRIPV